MIRTLEELENLIFEYQLYNLLFIIYVLTLKKLKKLKPIKQTSTGIGNYNISIHYEENVNFFF